MGHKDDARELARRAEKLHHCAEHGRALARKLAHYLDHEMRESGDGTWQGPFAEQTTATLKARRKALDELAHALTQDARRWDRAADELQHKSRTTQNGKGA